MIYIGNSPASPNDLPDQTAKDNSVLVTRDGYPLWEKQVDIITGDIVPGVPTTIKDWHTVRDRHCSNNNTYRSLFPAGHFPIDGLIDQKLRMTIETKGLGGEVLSVGLAIPKIGAGNHQHDVDAPWIDDIPYQGQSVFTVNTNSRYILDPFDFPIDISSRGLIISIMLGDGSIRWSDTELASCVLYRRSGESRFADNQAFSYTSYAALAMIKLERIPSSFGKEGDFYINLSSGATYINEGGGWKLDNKLPIPNIGGVTDPSATTNPAKAGSLYTNTLTGVMFYCTDATTDANVWLSGPAGVPDQDGHEGHTLKSVGGVASWRQAKEVPPGAGVIFSADGVPETGSFNTYVIPTDYGYFPSMYGGRTYRSYIASSEVTIDDISKSVKVGFLHREGTVTYTNIWIGCPQIVDKHNFDPAYPPIHFPDMVNTNDYSAIYTDPLPCPYDFSTKGILVTFMVSGANHVYTSENASVTTYYVGGEHEERDIVNIETLVSTRLYNLTMVRRVPAPIGGDGDYYLDKLTLRFYRKTGITWYSIGYTDTTQYGTTDPLVTTNPLRANTLYINTATGSIFICTDATTDANVWVTQELQKNISGAADPTATTNPAGIDVLYTNTTTGVTFICTDATVDANVWKTEISYRNLTGAASPTITTNPSAAGITFTNTTSGVIFTCTDATVDANVWIGTDGTAIP